MTDLSLSPRLSGDLPAPAEQIAQLSAILALVRDLAGLDRAPTDSIEGIDRRYDRAPQIAQSRFDSLAGETAAFAAAGLAALIVGRGQGGTASGGAAHLAREMERSIRRMEKLLG